MEKTNKLIAEFMGFTQEKNIGWYDNDMLMSQNVYDTNNGNCFDELLFDQSWDWLMPVVQKCCILNNEEGFEPFYDLCELKIATTHKAVVEFIKNQNT